MDILERYISGLKGVLLGGTDLNNKKSTTSDKNGTFVIEATVNEDVYFISKDYQE